MKRANERWCVLAWMTLVALAAAGCGARVPPERLLANLQQAMQGDVSDAEASAAHSRTVEAALDENVLNGLRRDEVEERIGRGAPCSRHPRCAEHDFADNDWFYEVGRPAAGYGRALPLLILGFDRTGRVVRSWNLRTH
ncbi:MAG: hypothetical protein GXP55_20075 [Deltaproteobacteria bacterium]|nr:hypothetical protein [Deltaproteobacteria bacterium]